MKKNILATLLLLSFTQVHALDADQVTRARLLDSNRLHEISKTTITNASESQSEKLKEQFKLLENGQTIIIPKGKYENFGQINISENNITIKAEEAGTVWFTGLVQFEIKGNDVILDGLVFTEGGPNERFGGVRLMGNDNTLVNSTFYYFNDDYIYEPNEKRQEYPKYLWISLWGKNAKVINNRFEGKLKRGTLMGIQKDKTADNHLIKNNIFVDMKSNNYNEFAIKDAIRYNSNTWEAVRIGDSKSSIYPSKTKFVDNLMIDMNGENEIISLKSGGNTVSGNTIFSSSGLISLRHGKSNLVENNVILGNHAALTGGIRVFDTDHVIKNNYIIGTRSNRGAIVINTGIIDVINGEILSPKTKAKNLNKQWTPQNIEVSNNTIIDAQWGIIHGSQVHQVSLYNNNKVEGIYGGDKIHFSNNLVQTLKSSQVAVSASSMFPITNSTYKNEVYSGKLVEKQQLSNYTIAVPKLTKVNGFIVAEGHGVDAKKLKIITADVAGPDYVLK